MFACLHVPDFSVQAALLSEPADTRESLRRIPIVVLDGPANLLKVVALNDSARNLGIKIGMTKLQVETCSGVLIRKRSEATEDAAHASLLDCANAFSPNVESTCSSTVILDLAGTERLLGTLESIATQLALKAREHGLQVHVAVASNPDTALYAAHGLSCITVIPFGKEAHYLARLNVSLLPITPEMLETLNSWGIHTFQSFAVLPEVPLTERLGQAGLRLQQLARGQVKRALVPTAPDTKFIEGYEFDDPVETLESLAFVLNRLLQQVCTHLTSHALATNELRLTLDLEVRQRRDESDEGERYCREWKLPVPTHDGKMLFTLVRLDLEQNTFSAPIRKVTVEAVPVKPRLAQGNLFARPSPEAERLEITMARIRGVVGSTDANGIACVGSPALVDIHRSGMFRVQPLSSVARDSTLEMLPIIALRAFRPALETSVELTGRTPHLVRLWKKHLRVLAASGPWCSSGNWWNRAIAWAHEEWDVALRTSAGVGFYRIYLDRIRKKWFVDGVFD
jgi:protein ImuB